MTAHGAKYIMNIYRVRKAFASRDKHTHLTLRRMFAKFKFSDLLSAVKHGMK